MFSHRPLLVGRQSTQRFPGRVQEQFLHRPLPLHRQHVGILQEISVRLSIKGIAGPPSVLLYCLCIDYMCRYGRGFVRDQLVTQVFWYEVVN